MYEGPLFWAASPNRSGVFVFVIEAERERWCFATGGDRLAESQVDPDIVRAERERTVDLHRDGELVVVFGHQRDRAEHALAFHSEFSPDHEWRLVLS